MTREDFRRPDEVHKFDKNCGQNTEVMQGYKNEFHAARNSRLIEKDNMKSARQSSPSMLSQMCLCLKDLYMRPVFNAFELYLLWP